MEYELRFRFSAGESTAKRLQQDITEMARKFGLTNHGAPHLTIVNRYDKTPPPNELHDVLLVDPGQKKINVIKTTRAYTSWGLKEAKDVVDSSRPTRPQYVLKEVPYYEAARCVAAYEQDGAVAIMERSFIDQEDLDNAIEGLRDILEKGI